MNLVRPILSAEFIPQDVVDLYQDGQIDELIEFFEKVSLSGAKATFSTTAFKDMASDVIITKYEGTVTSRFYINGELHVTTQDGFSFNLTRMGTDIKEYMERVRNDN